MLKILVTDYDSNLHCLDKAVAREGLLAKLYIFGEKILDAKFCNAVVLGFVRSGELYHEEYMEEKSLCEWRLVSVEMMTCNILYRGTAPGSPIRRYLVDTWVSEPHQGYVLWPSVEVEPESLRDLVTEFLFLCGLSKRPGSDEDEGSDVCLPKESWFKAEQIFEEVCLFGSTGQVVVRLV